jgi:hypothetical protein
MVNLRQFVRNNYRDCDKHIYAWIIQVTPYVFNAFVFQNLLDQTFFETYGIYLKLWN